MKTRVWALSLLLVGVGSAQMNQVNQVKSGRVVRRLRVRVEFANGICDPDTRVGLLGHMGIVAEGIPDNECVAEFASVPEGSYQVIVSGHTFSQSDAGTIVASMDAAEVYVKVNQNGDSAAGSTTKEPSVSAAELALPAKAHKEFAKASQLIQKKDFAEAIDRLNKLVAEYPMYASAYNNLAVIYARQEDYAKERDALEHAISANDHLTPCYVNLARLDINTKNFEGAEAALNKATALDPKDSMTLVLLGYVQLVNHHFDEAIATASKAHALQGAHAFTHQVAARAYEQKRDAANAVAQLRLFLSEEPTGPRAENARQELTGILSAQHSAIAAIDAQ